MTQAPLVDVATLAARISEGVPLRLLDVRWQLGGSSGAEEYRAGHLPGAVFLDLDLQLCGPPGRRGRHPLPDPNRLEAVLRNTGVQSGTPVVVYDAGSPQLSRQSAARAWWTLRWAGLPDVQVLDGGYAAWDAAGHPVTSATLWPDAGDVSLRPGGMPALDADGAAACAAAGRLLDVRAPERYQGEAEPIDPVAGHIPGAVNLPAADLLTADGRWADPEQVRERVAQAVPELTGAEVTAGGPGTDGPPLGVYCGSGVTAAHTVLALHRAGYLDTALYVGSFSHWITDPQRPVRTGAAP